MWNSETLSEFRSIDVDVLDALIYDARLVPDFFKPLFLSIMASSKWLHSEEEWHRDDWRGKLNYDEIGAICFFIYGY